MTRFRDMYSPYNADTPDSFFHFFIFFVLGSCILNVKKYHHKLHHIKI